MGTQSLTNQISIQQIQTEDTDELSEGYFDSSGDDPNYSEDLEKDEDDSKNSKTEIEEWLKSINNKFKIKIKKRDSDTTDLDQTDENDLKGLLDYLKTEENKDTLLKLIKNSNPTHLTFKKDGRWDVIHTESTINNWIDSTYSKQATLELWDDGKKKQLSDLGADDFKSLFPCLKKEKGLFNEDLETIIFEKYIEDDGDYGEWMPIKEAIKKFLDEEMSLREEQIQKIKIKKGEEKTLIEGIRDDELIGLFKHLRLREKSESEGEEGEKYSVVIRSREQGLLLEKVNNNEWKRIEDYQ